MTNKYEKLIMVVKRDNLFENKSFIGFMSAEKNNLYQNIIDNFQYIKRGDAENNEKYKQPIGYCILRNVLSKKIFIYQRSSKNKDYTETRLQGKWSWGIGGHIDKEDEQKEDPIIASMLREINEEVKIDGKIQNIKLLGYINDDSNNVGRVHFGILYLVDILGDVFPVDAEIKEGKMATINELQDMITNKDKEIEEWSIISLIPLKKL